VILFDADVVPQEPPDEVNVRVAVPVYPASGVQVAFNVVALGENVPPADDVQVPLVAGALTLPPKAAETPPWQIAAKPGPTLTVGFAVTFTVLVAVAVAHPPVPVTV
jgi:hypothetical protein